MADKPEINALALVLSIGKEYPATMSTKYPTRLSLAIGLSWVVLMLVVWTEPSLAAETLSLNHTHRDPIAPVILGVTGILFVAILGRFAARKFGQPSVLGELIMGIAIGNILYFLDFDFIVVLREGTAIFDMVELALQGQSFEQAAHMTLPPPAADTIVRVLDPQRFRCG